MITKTQKALSALEFAIAQCATHERMDDEFTLAEYVVKTRINRSTAQQQLDRLVGQGLLTKRKIAIDSRLTNLYRKP
jgi:predicted transcriptional regulator